MIYAAVERLSESGISFEDSQYNSLDKEVADYINFYSGLKQVVLTDDDLMIKWISPAPDQGDYEGKAVKDVFGSSDDLDMWLPVYDGMSFIGFMVAYIDINDYFTPVVEAVQNDYMIQLSDADSILFESDNWEDGDQEYAVRRDIVLEDTAVLSMTIAPTPQLIQSARNDARRTLFISLVFSLLFSAVVYFAQKYSEVSHLNEQRFLGTFESMSQGCQIISHDWRYLFINDTAEKQLRRNKKELIGNSVLDVNPGFRDRELFIYMEKCMLQRVPQSFEQVEMHPDGTVHYLDVSIEPSPDGILVLTSDVTDYKKANAALRISQEHYRNLFEASLDGIFIIDLNGNYVDANQSALNMVDYTLDELKQLNVDHINAHPRRSDGQVEYRKSWQSGASFELYLKKKNGEEFPVELTVSPIIVDNKQELVLGIARDISERKRIEKELALYSNKLEEMVLDRTKALERAQEDLILKERLATLGQLAGSIGHELRNPLGVINNAVYFLNSVLSDRDEKINDYLSIISTEVSRSSKIIEDLLNFARVKQADLRLVDMAEVIDKVVEQVPAPEGIEVLIDYGSDIPGVKVDPLHINQILTNLVTNGYQAMPDGGQLRIGVNSNKENVIVSISDNGVGISEDNMDNMFKPLFTTKQQGIGLGLALSQKLAEANGGEIDFESVEGQGSTFRLIMPIN